MSEFRFEKIRVPAELTLSSGPPVPGSFFVGGSASDRNHRMRNVFHASSVFPRPSECQARPQLGSLGTSLRR